MKKPAFAIDVGGVLASKQHEGQPREGSLEAVCSLANFYDLYIVSQCGRNRALKTIEWLEANQFPIPQQRQIYVPFSESKEPWLRQLEALYFVDDRMKHVIPALKVPSIHTVFHLPEDFDNGRYLTEKCVGSDKYLMVRGWDVILHCCAQDRGSV